MSTGTEASAPLPFRGSYACYLGILLWAPLPIGSNPVFYKLLLSCLLLAWVGIQQLPMRLQALQAIAPVNAAYFRNAGFAEGSISISPPTRR